MPSLDCRIEFHLGASESAACIVQTLQTPQERLWHDVFAAAAHQVEVLLQSWGTHLHQRSPSDETLARLSRLFQYVLSSNLCAFPCRVVLEIEGILDVPLLMWMSSASYYQQRRH